MKIAKDSVVTLQYLLSEITAEGKRRLESRERNNPVIYLHGYGQILPALEQTLEGQEAGYQGTLLLEPEKAYGKHRPELVVEVDRKSLPIENLALGRKFSTQGPDGEMISVFVAKIGKARATLDGNHPLAGLRIQFDVQVLAVREATSEEIEFRAVIGAGRVSGSLQ